MVTWGKNSARTSATSGISATDGIGRRNSTIARVALRTPGTLPSARPMGTATATVMTIPIAHASSVAERSVRNWVLATNPTVWPSTVDINGRADLLSTPVMPSTWTSTRKATTPSAPRAHAELPILRTGDGAMSSLLVAMRHPVASAGKWTYRQFSVKAAHHQILRCGTAPDCTILAIQIRP